MNCLLCDNPVFTDAIIFTLPDKYQRLIKNKGWHTWLYCNTCDFYVSENSETPEERRKIYMKYWQKELRGGNVEQFFQSAYPSQLGLNEDRIQFITKISPLNDDTKILDVGSGYATFPYVFKKIGQKIKCVEPEPTAAKFISSKLSMPCAKSFYDDFETNEKFSLITMSNVLEHFENPIKMLEKAKGQLRDGGSIFIEVPDGVEFDYLPEDHDDFNSLHLWFFKEASLAKMLEKAGLVVKGEMKKAVYRGMNASRVTKLSVMCEASDD